jgi:hypothetical protein
MGVFGCVLIFRRQQPKNKTQLKGEIGLFGGAVMISAGGFLRPPSLRPSCARPLGGPRISSAARHRLVWLLA